MKRNWRFIDRTGQTFGRLVIIAPAESRKKHTFWLCECSCGTIKEISAHDLTSGRTISCGCQKSESTAFRNFVHGAVGTREYRIWKGMRQRCLNANNPGFINYGGRGIFICDRWINSFANFISDMGPCPEGLSIERVNNNGWYEPSNCKWATPKEQRANQRPPRRRIAQ